MNRLTPGMVAILLAIKTRSRTKPHQLLGRDALREAYTQLELAGLLVYENRGHKLTEKGDLVASDLVKAIDEIAWDVGV